MFVYDNLKTSNNKAIRSIGSYVKMIADFGNNSNDVFLLANSLLSEIVAEDLYEAVVGVNR